MNILFTLTPAFNPNDGGVQRTTWKLGQYFTEQGYEVSYFSFDHKGHVEPDYGSLYKAQEPNKTHNSENIEELKKVIGQVQPDIVINQMPYEQELRDTLADLKDDPGYKLLGCLRNSLFSFKSNARDKMEQLLPSPIFTLLDNPLGIGLVQMRHKLKHRRDLKRIIDRHDYFILLAPPNREELRYFVGDYKENKVVSIPNSIPFVHEDLSQKEKIILHVGRINISQKRSDLLPDFWEKLHKQVPDWKFIIVGDGPHFDNLKSEVEQRNLSRISLEGFQKPEIYYKRASVFMMPSAYEGFPNTLLEAQSYGCAPVLFDSYKALEWVVEDDKNAKLITPFDAQAMADEVALLCNNSGTLKKMQLAALENAKRFTIERVGKKWESFFTKIMKL